MKKKLAAILLCLLSVLFVSCGKEAEKAKDEKDTLVFAQISECKTLDPQDTTEQYSQRIVAVVYDRLVEIDEMTGELVPGLAESWERLDENNIVFHLRKGIKFHNGDVFSANDVKYTLERAKTLPKVAHLYKLISNIEVIDDNTVKLTTSEPFAPLLAHLSHKTASIIDGKAHKELGEKYFENPAGTGPYKYSSWKVGDRITLEAFNEYFKGSPAIKFIEVRAVPEENSRVIGLETGEIDMTAELSPESRKIILDNADKMTYAESSGINVNYLGFATNREIMKDKDVRKAIAMAIDRDAIIDSIMMGTVEKANSFIAPGVFGYDKNSKVLEYNPEEAKKIIEAKGLVGTKLKLGVSNSPVRMQMCEIIQAQLKEVGLDVSIESLEWGTFLAATARGDLDMFSLGWGPSTYDGDYGFYPNFNSSQRGGAGNRSQYVNPEMDRLLDEAKKEVNVERRKELYSKVADIIYEDVPALPIYYLNDSVAAVKSVEGMKPTSYIRFDELSFKKEK